MKLHEYQAKQLFASVGIPIPRGHVARTPDEASAAYERLRAECGASSPAFSCNVKAQLHAGGRGKAGGVRLAASAQEAAAHARDLLGTRLVTKQTGPQGLPVSSVLVDERIDVAQELYLAITIDRSRACPMVLVSRRGGVDIEEIAVTEPAAILKEPIDLLEGPSEEALGRLARGLGCAGAQGKAAIAMLRSMWSLFVTSDASLIEINPLVITPPPVTGPKGPAQGAEPPSAAVPGGGVTTDARVLALDAKVTLDDNALFRHTELASLRDESQEHPMELAAGRIGISYVGLEGTIGCLVNGAGLAMATNDIIKLAGGEPANFLDVGGGASVEQVTKAFAIILEDPRVTVILVNIFGGIMRCDWIAQGLLKATETLSVKVPPPGASAEGGSAPTAPALRAVPGGGMVPIVVRLQGTNVEEGRALLTQAGSLNLISVDELEAAAKRAVELARK